MVVIFLFRTPKYASAFRNISRVFPAKPCKFDGSAPGTRRPFAGTATNVFTMKWRISSPQRYFYLITSWFGEANQSSLDGKTLAEYQIKVLASVRQILFFPHASMDLS